MSQSELFRIMMNMSSKLDSLVGNRPGVQTGDENIDPTFSLEIDIENSFENLILFLQTANPRGCGNSTTSKIQS